MEIKDHPNYLIYPDGRVWSKYMKIFRKSVKDKDGYRYLGINGKLKKIHRLVAEHYIPNPDNLPEVDHINRIRNDNRVENLRWVSRRENMNNKCKYKTNKSGHTNISLTREGYYLVSKTRGKNKKYRSRTFKNKIEAICYKYILLLKIKSSVIV